MLRVNKNKMAKAFLFLLYLMMSLGLIYIIYQGGKPESFVYWLGVAVEIIIAFLVAGPKRFPVLRLLLFVIAIALPLYLYKNVEGLKSLRAVWLVFLLISFWIGLYKVYRPKKTKTRERPLSGGFILPAYLTADFAETDRNQYRRKGYEIMELVYSDEKTGYVIWIKEAKGPIPDYKPGKNMKLIDKEIKAISIHIEQEILKPGSRRMKRGEPPFIDANWSHKEINFNLRTDGISLDESEKIIASMIS